MLTTLTIENIALVERAEIALGPGLNVLTGETGAGKSVVVTALALALGARADKEIIRHGAKEASIRVTFDISDLPKAFRDMHSDLLDGDMLTVERTLSHDGAARVAVNGKRVALSRLADVAAPLGQILGQHANQMLMDEANHLRFVDEFGTLTSTVALVGEMFREWKAVSDELRRVRIRREQLIQERELLLFQKAEIEKAELRVGEEETLVAEKCKLDAARSLMSASSLICDALGGEEHSILETLGAARKELDDMHRVDPALKPQVEELYDIAVRVEDLRRFIESYGSSIEDNPERIEEINLRLDEIYRLKKKYGGSEEAILAALASIHERLAHRPDTDSLISELETRTAALFDKYAKLATDLSRKRGKTAGKIEKLVTGELAALAIDSARFEFEFVREDAADGVLLDGRAVLPTENGLESARMLFSANPGEPVKSLVKTASGGEISRVLLALKAAGQTSKKAPQPLLVFDEIDAGIGGRTALEVGRKLADLSRKGQVVVITHLHQIARLADRHLVAEKSPDSRKRNVIRVRALGPAEIPAEIDRMVALPADTE